MNKTALFKLSLGLALALILVAGVVMLNRQAALAQEPSTRAPSAPQASQGMAFTYQGYLDGASGPISGTCDFEFSLWDNVSTGSQIGNTSDQDSVTVDNGYFSVSLDFGSTAFQGETRYLEIMVNCGSVDTPLSPRITLNAAPYALTLRPGAVVTGSINVGSSGTGAIFRTENTYSGAFGSISILGTAQNSGDGLGIGVKGIGEYGVTGRSSASAGYGVFGDNTANDGVGVYGRAGSASGLSPFSGGAGVWGDSANELGVYGSSKDLAGVRGESNGSYGVQGSSTDDAGVYGSSTNGYGVYGVGGEAPGVGGSSANYYGVQGSSTNSDGVHGSSSSGSGVYGSSNNGYGVQARSVYSYGVYGESTYNWGVLGISNDNDGVLGYSKYDGLATRAGVQGRGINDAHGLIGYSQNGYPLALYLDMGLTFRVFHVTSDGDVYADGGYHCGNSVESTSGSLTEERIEPCLQDDMPADFAEVLAADDELEPGDVLVIGPDGALARSAEAYQPTVVGVHSTRPSYVGGAANLGQDGFAPLAMMGVVPVKVSAENGPIAPGDMLVASATPGHAMTSGPNPPIGTVIGKALEGLESGTGVIQMLVMLQ